MTEEKKEPSVAEAKEGKEKIEVPEKFKKLIEDVEKMSVLDLAELVKVLEKKFGVSAAAPMAVAAAPAGAAAPAEDEKAAYNVVLTVVGDKKIEVIKVVRDATQKGLKEAKDLVDAAATGPQVVKENAKKEEADDLKKKLEAAGAKVELK
jgi:large subunit ribosomal protein L7/L12